MSYANWNNRVKKRASSVFFGLTKLNSLSKGLVRARNWIVSLGPEQVDISDSLVKAWPFSVLASIRVENSLW